MLKLTFSDTVIEKVENFEFLGLVLNEKMSWNNHINKLSRKISSAIGVMSKSKNILDKNILLKINFN